MFRKFLSLPRVSLLILDSNYLIREKIPLKTFKKISLINKCFGKLKISFYNCPLPSSLYGYKSQFSSGSKNISPPSPSPGKYVCPKTFPAPSNFLPSPNSLKKPFRTRLVKLLKSGATQHTLSGKIEKSKKTELKSYRANLIMISASFGFSTSENIKHVSSDHSLKASRNICLTFSAAFCNLVNFNVSSSKLMGI